MMTLDWRATGRNCFLCSKNLVLMPTIDVRNVLVIVALRQKDSLGEFNSEHCMQIVKCAKDLLSSLYDKVNLSQSRSSLAEQKSKANPSKKEKKSPFSPNNM